MKRMGIITSLIALSTVSSLTIVSCSRGPIPPSDLDTVVSIEPYWTLNYSFSTRTNAPFKLDFDKPYDGEVITVEIINQSLDPEEENQAGNYIRFVENQKQVLSFNISSATRSRNVEITVVDQSMYDELHEIKFSFKITVHLDGHTDKVMQIDNLWLMVARPAYEQDMFVYADTDKKILTGLNPEKQSDLEMCNMLVIPESVEEIAENAFYDKSKLKSLIPEQIKWLLLDNTWGVGQGTLKKIGNNAFRKAPFTGFLRFPNTLEEIGEYAFSGSTFVDSIIIPDSVTKIGGHAFDGCTGFNGTVKLPNKAMDPQSLGASIFIGCNNLTGDIVIPEQWTAIPSYMFSGCSKLNGTLTIPNTVKTIGQEAFRSCSQLKGNLVLPNQLESIGSGAFNTCSGLTGDLYIPDSVTQLGERAFYFCSSLDGQLHISDSLTAISDYAFQGCSKLSGELVLPENLQGIGRSAFESCISLMGDINIPNGVTKIGVYAFRKDTGFQGCLKIPFSVEEVANNAFAECSTLTEVDLTSWPQLPQIETLSLVFSDLNDDGGTVWIKDDQDIATWQTFLQDKTGLPATWICKHKE